jgi:two-component system, cell cycle sensor histidine kinase and response regulator CckA
MGRRSGKILLVDDEPALLKMMSLYLGRLGYHVETSSSTADAWRQVEAAPSEFAIAVLDATMPGLSMSELAERLLRSGPNVCVIAASGYPMDMAELEALGPGRVAFLHKPFSPEMLASQVRRMLAEEEEDV